MNRVRMMLGMGSLCGLAAMMFVAAQAAGEDKHARRADETKKAVETGARRALAGQPEAARLLRDRGKADIEVPLKTAVKGASATTAEAGNPKVQPGLVKWHPDLATACEAAKRSGKPVLLFHMMGKLDDQFC